jgi:hypothetical protein
VRDSRVVAADLSDELCLEIFVSSKLEASLDEISPCSGTKTCEESPGTFAADYAATCGEHAFAPELGVDLYASLNDIDPVRDKLDRILVRVERCKKMRTGSSRHV